MEPGGAGRRSKPSITAKAAASRLSWPEERVTFVEHQVVAGETLSHIARRYGVPLRDLEAANPKVRPKALQIGQRLTVPVSPRSHSGGRAGD